MISKRLFIFIVLLIALANFAFAGNSESSKNDSFKFVVFGDTQFDKPDVFAKAVKEANLLKPDFAIQVGDMITGYSYDKDKIREQWNRYKKEIAPLSMPFYPCAGNHDVTTTETESMFTEAWGENKFFYSFDHKGSHFIILDTDWHGQIDKITDDQLDWLKSDLQKNKSADGIYLFFHSNLFTNAKFNWAPFHELLKQYPVRAVFAGHNHTYSYSVRDGINYFTINTSGYTYYVNHLLGSSNSFVVASVNGGKPDFAVIADGNIYPPDAVTEEDLKLSGSLFEKEQTFQILDPSKNTVETEIVFPVENKIKEKREYVITWETTNFDVRFDPPGVKFSLEPGISRDVKLKLMIPQGKYTREDLPKIKISSPYKNSAGYDTTIVSRHSLFFPPETAAKYLSGKIVLDGKVDEDSWKNAAAISNLYIDRKNTEAKDKTVVKTLYDKENIYVGIIGDEPNPKGLRADAHGSFPLVFADDDYEIYFDPWRDFTTVYRMMTNPKGTVFSSGPDGVFTYKFEVKTFIGENFWSAEFKIPYSEIKAKTPEKGTVWGMNIRRARQQAESGVSEWSRMRGFPPQPEFFGILRFE